MNADAAFPSANQLGSAFRMQARQVELLSGHNRYIFEWGPGHQRKTNCHQFLKTPGPIDGRSRMPIVWTGLAPHPPIIVAGVGGHRRHEAWATVTATVALAEDFMEARADRLILISPHTPRPPKGISVWRGARLKGDFSRFGDARTQVQLPNDDAWISGFTTSFPPVTALVGEPLDHGASVPLHFLIEAGWQGPTCVLGLPWDEDRELDRLGQAIAEHCRNPIRTAILASGDMSHCLKPGAPAGYDARGHAFDQTFVDFIKKGEYRMARQIDPHLRQMAKQDVAESCQVAWTACDYAKNNHHFYGYEGPFGVGYAVMKFFGVPA